MSRTVLILALSAIVTSVAGCRMCADPYDHCGPTFTGQCGESCNANARAGSIFAGYQAAMQDETVIYDESFDGPYDGSFDGVYDGMIIESDEYSVQQGTPTPAPATEQAPRTIVAPPIPGASQGWTPTR